MFSGDFGFVDEEVAGRRVLDWLTDFATAFRNLTSTGDGGACACTCACACAGDDGMADHARRHAHGLRHARKLTQAQTKTQTQTQTQSQTLDLVVTTLERDSLACSLLISAKAKAHPCHAMGYGISNKICTCQNASSCKFVSCKRGR